MKRFLFLILACMLSFGVVIGTGCDNKPQDPKTYSFYCPDGAPALSVAKFINDGENFGISNATVNYTVVAKGDIGPALMKAEADFIVIPVNAASKLYKAKADSPYVMTAVLTHGNLYLMCSDGTSSLEELKGKVVGVIGQGLVPDLTLRAILSDNGLLDDVAVSDTSSQGKITFRYFNQAEDMIPLLRQGVLTCGLLPEPAATNLTKVASNRTWNRLDVQELYDAETKAYPQAVIMVRKSVYQDYKQQIDGMQTMFTQNVQWVKDNTQLAVQAVNSKLKQGVPASLVEQNINATVVDNCKIYYQSSTDAKAEVINYINKIIAIDQTCARAITQDFFAQ